MLPNDYSRCQGAVTEYIDADTRTISVDLHPQCLHCLRRIDVLDGVVYPWMDAPLGLLAGGDELCGMREI